MKKVGWVDLLACMTLHNHHSISIKEDGDEARKAVVSNVLRHDSCFAL